MNDAQQAEGRNDLLAPLLVILAILAAVIWGAWYFLASPDCKFCFGGGNKVATTVKNTEEAAPTITVNNNNSNVNDRDIQELRQKLQISALPATKPTSAPISGIKCDFGVTTLVITSVVNFSEVSLPFTGVGNEAMSLREKHTNHGRLTTGTLVTCANIAKKNFWIGFDGDYSPSEESDLKVSIHILSFHFESGKDFELVACDEGEDNPDECKDLGVHDDALHTFYAVVWPQ